MSLLKRLLAAPERGHGLPAAVRDVDAIVEAVGERMAAGRFGEALRVIQPSPGTPLGDARLLAASGAVLLAWGRVREAHAALAKAAAERDHDADLLVQLGRACLELAAPEDAERWLRMALAVAPNRGDVHWGLAEALQQQGRLGEARQSFECSLQLQPDNPRAHVALGNCTMASGDAESAERHFRDAIAVDETDAVAWGYLGVALERQGRPASAMEAFQRAVSLEHATDSSVDHFINLAISLRDAARIEESLAIYEARLANRPSAHGYRSYATALLTAGQLPAAWRFYEFRWLTEPQLSLRPEFGQPVWDGQDLSGKRVLLYAEQGLGDVIQFARYASAVKSLGATVLMFTSRVLANLAQSVPGVDRVVGPGETLVRPDFYVHLMSLPRIFGTGLDSIPASVPYLSASAERKARWAPRVAGLDGLRVGVVWAGSPQHVGDRQRSIPLERLSPLAAVAGVRFVSLQKGNREEDATGVAGAWLHERLGPEMEDLADAAAVIDELDLVICVDTALAHLAGALGKPVWVLLPTPADFRWMEEREDSPWYPTMRLFRQQVRGEWDEVIERVRAALHEVVGGGGAAALRERRMTAPAVKVVAANHLPRHGPGHRPGMSAVAETRHGIMQYLPDEADVGDALGWYGEWLEGQRETLSRWLVPGMTVLEDGAGVGAHALWLARILGQSGHLMTYEPRGVHQRILRQNLSANRIGNATMLREMEAVDDLQLDRLDWLKCDDARRSEGVLAGGSETLWRLRPKVMAMAADEAQVVELAGRMREYGYRCWRLETPLYSAGNFNRRDGDVFGGRIALALLAVPEEVDIGDTLARHVEMSGET